MTLREFREHPSYKNRLVGGTMYKRILEGWCRDYIWEHDIRSAENNGNLDAYSDWLDREVQDFFISNAEIVQVNLSNVA